jgi:membrane fusion protein
MRLGEEAEGGSMDATPLFRPEAVVAQRTSSLGRIAIVGSTSFGVLSASFAAIAAAVCGFAYFGTYTDHRTLRGRLVTQRSVIDVRSPQFGIVAERRVAEGQVVERGDVLYVVSSERISSDRGATQRAVGAQLDSRRRSLTEQIANVHALARLERGSIDDSIAELSAEAVKLAEATESQSARTDLARQTAERYERIGASGFVSEEQLVGKRADLLEQRGRLLALEREQRNVERQLAELNSRLAMAAVRHENEVAELERAVAETDLQVAENEARRAVVVSAPDAGVATGIGADVGDAVDSGTPLAFIVPADSDLLAELYAPSRAAGFLGIGQDVLLRYEAYPYQKFGHYRGSVSAVSRTALAPTAFRYVNGGPDAGGGPVFQVTVALESQTVTAYGERRTLRPGMTVEADVLLESRRLYEWVFEPLYSLSGERH